MKIIFAITLSLLVGVLKLNPFWNLHKYLYQYVLIDDEQYQENSNIDSDPLFGSDGSNGSSYNSSFRYFTNIKTNMDGLSIPQGKIIKDENSRLLADISGEYITINTSNSIFWQYAIIRGYKPLYEGKFNADSFVTKIFKVGLFYILELFLINISQSILFAIIVLLIYIKWPEYLFKRINT